MHVGSSLSSLEIIEHPPMKSGPNYLALSTWILPFFFLVSLIISPLVLVAGLPLPVLLMLIATIIVEVVTVLFFWRLSRQPFRSLFMTWKPFGKGILVAVGVGVASLVGLQLISVLTQLLGGELASSETSELINSTVGWQRWIVLLLFIPILVPIAEEFLFRGLLYNFMYRGLSLKFSRGVSFWIAAGTSGLAFGFMHFQGLSLLGIFIVLWSALFGVMAAWLYQRYGSIWSPIIAHSTYNGLTVLLMILVG